MRIDSNGYVGIGTISPSRILHTVGDAVLFERSGQAMTVNPNYGNLNTHAAIDGHGGKQLRFSIGDSDKVTIDSGGDVGIGTTTPQAKLDVNGKINCTVLELTSDRNQKQDAQPVSAAEVLAQVVALPVTTWAYTNSPNVRHLGPMAQDFQAAFHIGESDKHIGAGDGIGVALAAIKGLHELVQEKDSEIAALQRQVTSMKQELASVKDTITDRLAALEKAVGKNVQQASNAVESMPALTADAR